MSFGIPNTFWCGRLVMSRQGEGGIGKTDESYPAEIKVKDETEDVKVMSFGKGYVDLTMCEAIKVSFSIHHEEGTKWLFDLTEASFLDSEATKAMLACTCEAQVPGIVVCDDTDRPYRVLSRLEKFFDTMRIVKDVKEGLKVLGRL
jgi:hypothetical protein